MPDEPAVAFGDLPEPGGGGERTLHSLIAAQLRQRPGEWARIATRSTASNAASTAHSIRSAKLRPYAPAGAYEAAARTEDGVHSVHARYVGEAEPE